MPLLRPAPASLCLVLALSVLGGCKQTAGKGGTAASDVASEAVSETPISDARLILPAVKGNPGAAYFSVRNDTTGTRAISGLEIGGVGKAEMHQTIGSEMTPVDRVDIAPATSIAFEPGKLHVMAFDVAGTLRPGGTTTLTVVFATGDKASATMQVEAAGATAMGGMDHGDAH